MWKAPYRPRNNDISQPFSDGIVKIYRQIDTARPGYAPKPSTIFVASLAFEEQRVGIQRYYEGKQNQIQVEKVLRVPRGVEVSNQDVAVVVGTTTQYRIDLVQTVDGVYPPSLDLTLTKIAQTLPLEEVPTE